MTARLMQLYALRSIVDALILAEAGEMAQSEPGTCPRCGAPEEKQVDTSTLDGTRRTMCLQCRQERAA